MLLDPRMQRELGRRRWFGEQQRDRLRQITDRLVALLEEPLGYITGFRRPCRQPAHWDETLRPLATQEMHGPRGVRGLSICEIRDHRLDLLAGASRLVDGG